MPIPFSGPVSFNNIQTEFGGTNPISINEYYNASGKYCFNIVGIPTNGQISMNNFRGKTKTIIISASISGTNNTINNVFNNSNFKYAYFSTSGTFSINNDMTCEVLLIGGGGGGGFNNGWEGGGGGGAGGLGLGTINLKSGITYNITIGNGGAGGPTAFTIGQNGSNTTIIGDVINENAYGGGGGSFNTGNDGGSGGGASGASADYFAGNATKGLSSSGANANIIYYGNKGGDGINPGGGGGGGGAGAAGNPTGGSWNFEGAVGGIGLQSSITGISTYYAGGGGGARGIYGTNGGAGGLGGGGRGAGIGGAAVAGTANTGGGGGGVGTNDPGTGGASGGSGLVIIKYAIKVYTTGNLNTINTPTDNANYRYAYFTNSGTFTTFNSLICDILIVGGGGSGGGYSGGGGGGDVIYKSNYNLASGTYIITVGNGGIAPRSGNDNYINGNPGQTSSITSSISNFITIYAAGGGAGIGYNKSTPTITPTAGSIVDGNYSSGGGGGAGADQQNYLSGSGNGVSGDGGRSIGIYASGGGGGATGNGGNPNISSNIAGIGGSGFTSAITGTNIGYGGGGGGSSWVATSANVGVDGGGNGGTTSYSATDGVANRGGGGGGAATGYVGGNGGSGVVIIRYLNN